MESSPSKKFINLDNQINRVPQLGQMSDIRAIQIKQEEAHAIVMDSLRLLADQEVQHNAIVDQAADIQKRELRLCILKHFKSPGQKQI